MRNQDLFLVGLGLAPIGLIVALIVYDLCRPRPKVIRSRWWDEYHAFLASERWQCIRYAKLCEARFTCQVPGCRGKVLQVHHLSYRNYQEGNLKDLVVLCHEHHQAVHGRAF